MGGGNRLGRQLRWKSQEIPAGSQGCLEGPTDTSATWETNAPLDSSLREPLATSPPHSPATRPAPPPRRGSSRAPYQRRSQKVPEAWRDTLPAPRASSKAGGAPARPGRFPPPPRLRGAHPPSARSAPRMRPTAPHRCRVTRPPRRPQHQQQVPPPLPTPGAGAGPLLTAHALPRRPSSLGRSRPPSHPPHPPRPLAAAVVV